ncbi:MAG: YggT family protein [Candidatus Berkiellales bacterium]
MDNPLHQASLYLIQSIFDIYLLILLLRLILQYLRADFYNPVSQFVVKATSPIVNPLRRVIPGYWGIDFATVVALVAVSFLKIILVMLINFQHFPSIAGLVLWTLGSLTGLTIKLFFYAVLLSIVISWIAPTSHSPLTLILYHLSEPVLRPARRYIPPIGGFDISPLVVIVVLQAFAILFTDPLTQAGIYLALR